MAAKMTTAPTPIAIFFQVFIASVTFRGPRWIKSQTAQDAGGDHKDSLAAIHRPVRRDDGHISWDTILLAGKFQSGIEYLSLVNPEYRDCRNVEIIATSKIIAWSGPSPRNISVLGGQLSRRSAASNKRVGSGCQSILLT